MTPKKLIDAMLRHCPPPDPAWEITTHYFDRMIRTRASFTKRMPEGELTGYLCYDLRIGWLYNSRKNVQASMSIAGSTIGECIENSRAVTDGLDRVLRARGMDLPEIVYAKHLQQHAQREEEQERLRRKYSR